MRKLFSLLLILTSFVATAQKNTPYGSQDPTGTNYSPARTKWPFYSNNDTKKVLGVDNTGVVVLKDNPETPISVSAENSGTDLIVANLNKVSIGAVIRDGSGYYTRSSFTQIGDTIRLTNNSTFSSNETVVLIPAKIVSAPVQQGLNLASSGDWYVASGNEVQGADKYRLYRNTTNNPNTATLIYEGEDPLMIGVPLIAGATNYIWFAPVTGVTEGSKVASGSASVPSKTNAIHLLVDGDSNTANNDDGALRPSLSEEIMTLISSDPKYEDTVANIGISGQKAYDEVVQKGYKQMRFLLNNVDYEKVVAVNYGTNDMNTPLVKYDEPDAVLGNPFSLKQNIINIHQRYHDAGVKTIAVTPGERGHYFSNPPQTKTFPQFYLFGQWVEDHYKDTLNAETYLTFTKDSFLYAFVDPQYLYAPYNGLPYTTPGADSTAANNAFYFDSIHPAGFRNQAPLKVGIRRAGGEVKKTFDKYAVIWRKQTPVPTVSIDNGNRTATVTLRTGYNASDYEMSIDGGLTWSSFSSVSKSIGRNSHEIGHLRIRTKMKYNNPHGISWANATKIAAAETETWVPITNGSWTVPNDWTQVSGTAGTSPGGINAYFPNTVNTSSRASFQFTKGFKFINYIDADDVGGTYDGTPLGYRIYVNNTLVKETYAVLPGQLVYSYEAAPDNTVPIDVAIQCTWGGAPYTSKGAIHGAWISGVIAPRVNYALATAGTTATALYNYSVGDYRAARTIDGSLVTSASDWEANVCWRGSSVTGNYPQYIDFDLGQTRSINQIVIVGVRTPLNYTQAPTSLETSPYAIVNAEVQYKLNSGDSWSTFGNLVGNNLVIKKLDHADISLRYIRVYFTSKSETNPELESPVIVELQAFGN